MIPLNTVELGMRTWLPSNVSNTVFKGIITNFSLNPERRFDFVLGVETDDIQHAVQLGKDVISNLSFVLEDPAADAWLNSLGNSTMEIWFGGWINQSETSLVKARAEAIRQVMNAFEAEGIFMPEPVYRLRFDDDMPFARPAKPAEKAAKGAKPAKSAGGRKPAEAPAPAPEVEQDVSPDHSLQERVREAGRQNDSESLLDEEAPQEVTG
ncbi:MAG: hypothetical protein AAFU56_06620, partial [Pseudomonadota bacterium]